MCAGDRPRPQAVAGIESDVAIGLFMSGMWQGKGQDQGPASQNRQ
jgi:hypothetical protein